MPTTFTNLKNNCATVLNTSVDGVTTTLQAVAGGGALFPPTPFYLSCEYEVMRCTGRSADTLTVVRGQDGTTAVAHPAGAVIEQRNNAAMWTDISGAVSNIENGTTQVPFNPPDGSITNKMLASDVARPNLVQNGGFEVWTPRTSTAVNGVTFADPWSVGAISGVGFNLAPDTANAESGTCVAISGAAGVNSTNYVYINQAILNPAQLAGKVVTLSARVKTSTPNSVRMRLWDGLTNVYSGYHPGSGVYATLTLTMTLSASATVVSPVIQLETVNPVYIDNVTLVYGTIGATYYPAQIADAVPNARLAADVARYSYLTNGSFDIWQRGAGPFATLGQYGPDRWFSDRNGTSTVSVARESVSDGGNPGTYQAVLNYTHAAGGDASLIQIIEDSARLRGKWVTFSARVYCNNPNNARLSIYDGVVPAAISPYAPVGWSTVSVSINVAAGSPVLQVRITVNGSTDSVRIHNAMLVVGSTPADYAPLTNADDLARCLRYYETLFQPSEYGPIGQAISGVSANYFMSLKSQKAATPTATISTPTSFNTANSGGGALAATAVNSVQATVKNILFGITVASGLTAGNATFIIVGANANIALEANP